MNIFVTELETLFCSLSLLTDDAKRQFTLLAKCNALKILAIIISYTKRHFDPSFFAIVISSPTFLSPQYHVLTILKSVNIFLGNLSLYSCKHVSMPAKVMKRVLLKLLMTEHGRHYLDHSPAVSILDYTICLKIVSAITKLPILVVPTMMLGPLFPLASRCSPKIYPHPIQISPLHSSPESCIENGHRKNEQTQSRSTIRHSLVLIPFYSLNVSINYH